MLVGHGEDCGLVVERGWVLRNVWVGVVVGQL